MVPLACTAQEGCSYGCTAMVMWFLFGGLLERFACTGYNAVFNYFGGRVVAAV
jgi:hypothetical protein